MNALVGVALALATAALMVWALTAAAVAYALWRYAYLPWKAMRVDVAALDTKFKTLEQYVNSVTAPRRAEAKTDEEIAFLEQRLSARSKARIGLG